MEWVETTARSVDEAKDAALDQLGVDEQEAEFEILEEPRAGLFGRMRGEARVRARVKPRQPRAKTERGGRRRGPSGGGGGGSRNRRGGRSRSGGKGDTGGGKDEGGGKVDVVAPADAGPGGPGKAKGDTPRRAKAQGPAKKSQPAPQTPRAVPGAAAPAASAGAQTIDTKEQTMTDDDVSVQEQADIMEGFLEGLVDAFGVGADIRREEVDDETIELDLEGADLGLLIGPKGRTLSAIQELARTVVQRQATGTHHGRVRIDVGGYRQRRKEALERFTEQVAGEVRESGVARSLEPMGAADRKIVHDTVNAMDGVTTTSQGEEPRRRVVIQPEH